MIPTPADPRELGLETTESQRAELRRLASAKSVLHWSRLIELLDDFDRLTAALSEEREACAKIAYIPPDQPDHDGRTRLPSKRDELGHLVRRAWIAWAKTQPNPKPSWLVPYSGLSPEDREADCQIGEAVANHIAAAIRGRSNV